MALKVIMLRRSIDQKKSELAQLRDKDAEFQTREAEIEASIEEAETDEQRAAVNEEIDKYEGEKAAHDEAKAELEREIAQLEEDLANAEKDVPQRSAQPAQKTMAVRGVDARMNVMTNIRDLPISRRAFDALSMEQRNSIVAQEDVKTFLMQLRSMKGQTREVNGADLTIPVVFLELISENMYRYSKLINRVRMREVNGVARQTIAGVVPEAIWTEMCGALNELNFAFGQVTLDGYKVGGFVAICNSILDDNDINLSGWIVEAISEAIGLALDKAILYGKGASNKMPMGIVTRLAQTQKPSDYPSKAPEWIDLHTTNILKVDSTEDPVTFWSALAVAAGNTYTRYSRGNQFWAMNSKTYAKLRSKLITFNYDGTLVAQFPGIMPVIGGDVDVLEFIPDGDIIGGYGDLYLLAVRSGMTIESSREVQFIEDNTVFKGIERADGQPVIPGAFVAININNTAVTTVLDFAADNANDAQLTGLSIAGVTLTPSSFSPTTYTYTGSTTTASGKIEATPAQAGAQVAISYNGQNVRNGGTITWEASALPVTVTVTQGNAVRVYTVTVTKTGG